MRGRCGVRDHAWMLVAVAVFAAASVATSSWMAWEVRGDHESVKAAIAAVKKERAMSEMRAEWVEADGTKQFVVTRREDGWDHAEWASEHKKAVDAAKALFPPA